MTANCGHQAKPNCYQIIKNCKQLWSFGNGCRISSNYKNMPSIINYLKALLCGSNGSRSDSNGIRVKVSIIKTFQTF